MNSSPTTFQRVIAALQRIAPLELAESWDNVGLLLQSPLAPPSPSPFTILLSNDFTEAVVDEAIFHRSSLLFAYHPPIFSPLKRLTLDNAKERALLKCVANGINIYSPHTALDSCKDGINEWLAAQIAAEDKQHISKPIMANLNDSSIGSGRVLEFSQPVPLDFLFSRIKRILCIDFLRVALPPNCALPSAYISSMAICVGSGATVLSSAPSSCQLWLTGEMSHHQILAATEEKGKIVILTEHSNCERPYLAAVLKGKLEKELGDEIGSNVNVKVSEIDKDPLKIY